MADADEIRQAAEDIVSQPEYRPTDTGVVQRGMDWLGDRLAPVGETIIRFLRWLESLFNVDTGGPAAGGEGGYWLGWILLAVAAAAVVWFLIRVMPRRRLSSVKSPKPTVEARSRERATRKQWLALAAAAEAERDFTGAVRARYWALIAGLADRRELVADDAVTSGEHVRAFASEGERVAQLMTATDRFERAWYGDQPVELADSRELAGIDHDLVEGGRS